MHKIIDWHPPRVVKYEKIIKTFLRGTYNLEKNLKAYISGAILACFDPLFLPDRINIKRNKKQTMRMRKRKEAKNVLEKERPIT